MCVCVNLSSEKQLFTMDVAPVASTSLPTPLPLVSLITTWRQREREREGGRKGGREGEEEGRERGSERGRGGVRGREGEGEGVSTDPTS